MKKIVYASLLFGALALAVFYVHGRSIWHPVYVKITGGKSVSGVVQDIKEHWEDELYASIAASLQDYTHDKGDR